MRESNLKNKGQGKGFKVQGAKGSRIMEHRDRGVHGKVETR